MSGIILKTPEQIEAMAGAGRLLAGVFTLLDGLDLTGKSTLWVNDLVENHITRTLQARPASKGQYGFAYVLNASRNEVVCHGVPAADDILLDGDIVNLDITLEKNGWIADSSKTYCIGTVSPAARRLVKVTQDALWQGIRAVRPGATVGDIGNAIQRHARLHGYGVVREYCGHGIGEQMHEEPHILHFGRPGSGPRLEPGMVFTIEPMLTQGSARVLPPENGWAVRTRDGKLSAQFEHTVAVTADGVRVLTLRPEEGARYSAPCTPAENGL